MPAGPAHGSWTSRWNGPRLVDSFPGATRFLADPRRAPRHADGPTIPRGAEAVLAVGPEGGFTGGGGRAGRRRSAGSAIRLGCNTYASRPPGWPAVRPCSPGSPEDDE